MQVLMDTTERSAAGANIYWQDYIAEQLKEIGMNLTWIAGAVLIASSASADAQDKDALYLKSLAATCASCHGTNGSAAAGSSVPSLAGMSKDAMVIQMKAFKSGTRPATIMHQISKGYSDAQIEQMAGYFAAQTK
jgi:sulfide dehydrogenase cytochrome subunit